MFYRIPDLKTVKVIQNEENLRTAQAKSLRRWLNVRWCVDGILEQKKDFREKQRKSE